MKKGKKCRPCPICQNATSVDILYTQKFTLPDNCVLPKEYDLIACSRCGFIYTNTPVGQDGYDKYYREMSKYEMAYINSDTLLFSARADWMSTFICDRKYTIIDIGCGNGQLLLELKKRGFINLTALDPSQKCIEAISNIGIAGMVGSAFNITTTKQYDCVILSGVLEHIYDVSRLMQTVKLLTKATGLLFVFVPDASRYKDYDTTPCDYFNIEHINHFAETSLINLGYLHGFRAIGLLKTTINFFQTKQPVLFCAYQNVGIMRARIQYDTSTKDLILKYIAKTQQCGKAQNRIIDELAKSQEEIVIWGAGNYTSRLLATSNLAKCNIKMFVDNDQHKHGLSLCGKTICPPRSILAVQKKIKIVVAAAVFYNEIVAEIHRMGIDNKVIVLNEQ